VAKPRVSLIHCSCTGVRDPFLRNVLVLCSELVALCVAGGFGVFSFVQQLQQSAAGVLPPSRLPSAG